MRQMKCHHNADYASLQHTVALPQHIVASLQHLSANANSFVCMSPFVSIGLVNTSQLTCEYVSFGMWIRLIWHVNTSHLTCVQWDSITTPTMGWLQCAGSIKLYVSFAEYCLFCRALLQKRRIILSILLTQATPYASLQCLPANARSLVMYVLFFFPVHRILL